MPFVGITTLYRKNRPHPDLGGGGEVAGKFHDKILIIEKNFRQEQIGLVGAPTKARSSAIRGPAEGFSKRNRLLECVPL